MPKRMEVLCGWTEQLLHDLEEHVREAGGLPERTRERLKHLRELAEDLNDGLRILGRRMP